MKKIYTKTGDEGMTGLRGGVRVPKDDLRIETNGMMDELNSVIGICRSLMGDNDDEQGLLRAIQQELMTIMSHVATPEGKTNPRELHVEELTKQLEHEIDLINDQVVKCMIKTQQLVGGTNSQLPIAIGFFGVTV